MLGLLPAFVSFAGIADAAALPWLVAPWLAAVGLLMICRLRTFALKGLRDLARAGALAAGRRWRSSSGSTFARFWLLMVLVDLAYLGSLAWRCDRRRGGRGRRRRGSSHGDRGRRHLLPPLGAGLRRHLRRLHPPRPPARGRRGQQPRRARCSRSASAPASPCPGTRRTSTVTGDRLFGGDAGQGPREGGGARPRQRRARPHGRPRPRLPRRELRHRGGDARDLGGARARAGGRRDGAGLPARAARC